MTNISSSSPSPLACVILAAGQGTRMKSRLPKVMHAVASVPMINHVLHACTELFPQRILVVIPPKGEQIEKAVSPHRCVVQKEPLGTGDAVKAARKELEGFKGDIIVLFGDAPLITAKALSGLQAKKRETEAAIVVAGFTPLDPTPYGRLLIDEMGYLNRIVENAEASSEEKEITLCNGGVMLFDAEHLWLLLEQISNNNSKKEFYLTDCIEYARRAHLTCAVAHMPANEVLGINTRVELAKAEKLMQERLRHEAMLNGATFIDPDTVYMTADTKIGRDTIIGPNVFIGPGVIIANNVEIRAFCHLERAEIQDGAIIGPFARLRPGTRVGADAHIGNFVELKNADIDKGAKINHLSYIGDAYIGTKANIGAGTITCNYDGFRKFHTHVGAETFIGSNSSLVAPVKIGDGAYVGAGSVITMEVPAHTLAVARGRQANIDDWARRFREQQLESNSKNNER